MNTPIYIVDAQNVDENENRGLVEIIDKYIACALPDNTKHPEMRNQAEREDPRHTTTCRKKNIVEKNVVCRFNVPWAPSDKARIIRSEEKIDEIIVKQSKKHIEKVFKKYFLALLQ